MKPSSNIRFSKIEQIFLLSSKKLIHGRYAYHAAALSFISILALIPLLSVSFSILILFPAFHDFLTITRNYVMENFIPISSANIEYYLSNFVLQANKIPLMSLLFLFFSAIVTIRIIQTTLNSIWEESSHRKHYSSWLIYWSVFLFSPLVVGASIFLSTYVFSLSWLTEYTFGFSGILLAATPFAINAFVFSLIYIVIPRYYVSWTDGIFGGLIASLLFEVSKIGFAFYLNYIASYEVIYGTLSVIPIVLMWIYISWIIVLYGAIFACTCSEVKLRAKKSN